MCAKTERKIIVGPLSSTQTYLCVSYYTHDIGVELVERC